MLILSQLAVGYLRQALYDLLADIHLAHVAVIVDEYLEQHH